MTFWIKRHKTVSFQMSPGPILHLWSPQQSSPTQAGCKHVNCYPLPLMVGYKRLSWNYPGMANGNPPLGLVVKCQLPTTTSKVKCQLSPPKTSKVRSTCVGRGAITKTWLWWQRLISGSLLRLVDKKEANYVLCLSPQWHELYQFCYKKVHAYILKRLWLTFKKPLKNHSRTSPSWLIS